MSEAACAEEEETGTRSSIINDLADGLLSRIEMINSKDTQMSVAERKMLNQKLKQASKQLLKAYNHLSS